jgi:hypothetical protein
MQQAQMGQWLQVKLQENFRAQSNLSDAKWRQMEYRMIFVHDRMTADEAYGMFMNFLDWEDEDAAEECSERAERLAHGPAREAFRRMIQTLPAGRAVKKVGHVTEPVASDVYLGPDSMDGEVE